MFLRNTLSSAKLKRAVNMTAVALLRGKTALNMLTYEPEIYPAHICKKVSKKIVYYTSGTIS